MAALDEAIEVARAMWERVDRERSSIFPSDDRKRSFAAWVECYPELPGPSRDACMKRMQAHWESKEASDG